MAKINKKHQIPKIIQTSKSNSNIDFQKNENNVKKLFSESKQTFASQSEMELLPNRFKQKYCKKYFINFQRSKYFLLNSEKLPLN
jgi:hypothetical protein